MHNRSDLLESVSACKLVLLPRCKSYLSSQFTHVVAKLINLNLSILMMVTDPGELSNLFVGGVFPELLEHCLQISCGDVPIHPSTIGSRDLSKCFKCLYNHCSLLFGNFCLYTCNQYAPQNEYYWMHCLKRSLPLGRYIHLPVEYYKFKINFIMMWIIIWWLLLPTC